MGQDWRPKVQLLRNDSLRQHWRGVWRDEESFRIELKLERISIYDVGVMHLPFSPSGNLSESSR
jgi:hypothetical protein